MNGPLLAVTPGEPAGIGPELLVQLLQQPLPGRLRAYADPDLLHDRARRLGLPLRFVEPGQPTGPGALEIHPVPLPAPAEPGQLNPANAEYVLRTLEAACDACLHGEAAALVTGPLHKGIINEAGIPFTGHTEFLQARCNTEQVVMMLANETLRVALATTHLPLRAVADALTPEGLRRVLEVLHHDLQQRFHCPEPHIVVLGLNPHAGEGGHLGDEEIRIIEPVLETLRQQGMHLTGPLPADTAFQPSLLQQADAFLAMYHDQGLPVLKFAGFGQSINITLGLPIIRTSVDHGTALELAGSGLARTDSFLLALQQAARMAGTA